MHKSLRASLLEAWLKNQIEIVGVSRAIADQAEPCQFAEDGAMDFVEVK